MNTLECCLWSGSNDDLYSTSGKIPNKKEWLSLRAERATSFVLEVENNQLQLSVPSSDSIYLLIRSADSRNDVGNDDCGRKDLLFLLGGLEINSNARNIELYQSPFPKKGNSEQMEYVSTHRGTKKEEEKEESYKTIAIMENKTPSYLVALKLLSIRKDKSKPNAKKEAQVSLLKIKAKVIPLPSSTSVSQKKSIETNARQKKNDPHTSSTVTINDKTNPLRSDTTSHTNSKNTSVFQQQSIFSNPSDESRGRTTTEDNLVKAISALNINLQAMESRLQTQISKQFSQIHTMMYEESRRRQSWEQNILIQLQQQQTELLEKLAKNNDDTCKRIEQQQLSQEKNYDSLKSHIQTKKVELVKKVNSNKLIETDANMVTPQEHDYCATTDQDKNESTNIATDVSIDDDISPTNQGVKDKNTDDAVTAITAQDLDNTDSNVKQIDKTNIINNNTDLVDPDNDGQSQSTKRWIQQFSTELMEAMEQKYGSTLLRIVEKHEKELTAPPSPIYLQEHKTKHTDKENNDLISLNDNDNVVHQNDSKNNFVTDNQWNYQHYNNVPHDLLSNQYNMQQDEILIPLNDSDKAEAEPNSQLSPSKEYNELFDLQVD